MSLRLSKKMCSVLLWCIILLSFLPLFYLSRYSFLSADDFNFIAETSAVWEKTGSLTAVISTATSGVVDMYHSWQGTFAFLFMLFLQPATFHESWYWISAVIALLSIIASLLFFFRVLMLDFMKLSKPNYRIASGLLIFLAIQYCYDPVEGFFWHSGAIPYTLLYAVALFAMALMLKLSQARSLKAILAYTFAVIVLTPLIGGGNYSMALVTPMFTALLLLFLCIQKKKPHIICVSIILALLLIGLLISVTAPGNGLRQNTVGQPSAIKGIATSLIYGAYSMANATTAPALIVWLFLAPVLYRSAKASSYSFRYPLLVLILLFGLYSALGTPCFYALGFAIPERNINLIYFSYYPVMATMLYYLLGWISKKNIKWLNGCIQWCEEHFIHLFFLCAVLFAFACVGLCTVEKGENGNPQINNMPAGAEAAYLIITGEAQDFYDQMTQRSVLLRQARDQDVTLSPLTSKPDLLFYLDITPDPSRWENQAVAAYYGNRSVVLSE